MNLKKTIRPAMLICPLILGVIFPQGHVLASPPCNLIRWTLFGMIFINVLQIRFRDLQPKREHGILLAANIFMGIVPFYLLKFLIPSTVIPAQAAFFAGIAPTAASAAVIISLLNGNTGFAVTGFMISNIGISCALIFLLPLVTGNFSTAFISSVAWSLFTTIVIPLTLARITVKICPSILKYINKLKFFSLCLWSLSLYVIAGIAKNYIDTHANEASGIVWLLLMISFVICVINFGCGGLPARKEFKWESSQLLGQKNTTFAIFIALSYASGAAALSTIFYVLFHNAWNSWQLITMYKKNPRTETGENETQNHS